MKIREQTIALWRGDVPLWKAFWLFNILAPVGLYYLAERLIAWTVLSYPKGILVVRALAALLSLTYAVVVYVGIWRSASKYTGPFVWSGLAKVAVTLSVIVGLYSVYFVVTLDTDDPGKDSYNIASHLIANPRYPYIGFWKDNCNDEFGLALNEVGDGFYSVSFCGPGGCFKPGTYRPNSKIVDDSNYKVLNSDTIEVRGLYGYFRYIRCK